MVEDRFVAGGAPREGWLFPHIFRTFRVALDPKKLVLAAAGIVVMALGWWLISVAFYSAKSRPTLPAVRTRQEIDKKYPDKSAGERDAIERQEIETRDREYNEDWDRWLQLHYLAGSGLETANYQPDSNGKPLPPRSVWGGRLRTMPWYEHRGPNPYLLVTDAKTRKWEWEPGQFWDWAINTEVPVLLEPLVKFLEPIVYLLSPKSGTYTRIYLLVIVLWTLATWALFGGAITRMATVELAGKDPIAVTEALQFVYRRYASYLLGPVVPLGLVAVLVLVSIVFGLLHMIPAIGDVLVSGLFWPFMILVGLGMALLLVGLVGYPMMYPTISAEGSDTLDALSRSYNYVYQSPWSYIFYGALALLYGAVVIFFVGFMGSFTVYLGKWAIGNTPFIQSANRSPEYLFIYSPTSFGWRQVLVSGSPAEDITRMEDEEREYRARYDAEPAARLLSERWRLEGRDRAAAQARYDNWLSTFYVYNTIGAAMVSFWVTLVFLMVLGFGYSFFWTASSMIYLMMRRRVDDIDIDEVYLEETEPYDPFAGMPTQPSPSAAAPPVAGVGTTQMQETLTVRNDNQHSPPPAPAPTPAEPTPPTPPAGEPTP
jgi:hypothetical protein